MIDPGLLVHASSTLLLSGPDTQFCFQSGNSPLGIVSLSGLESFDTALEVALGIFESLRLARVGARGPRASKYTDRAPNTNADKIKQ